jgi:hypothetical protein
MDQHQQFNTAYAYIETIPSQMGDPTTDSSSDIAITISLSALLSPDNGDSSIKSYELYWDNGSGSTPNIQLEINSSILIQLEEAQQEEAHANSW